VAKMPSVETASRETWIVEPRAAVPLTRRKRG